jgi:proline racemase
MKAQHVIYTWDYHHGQATRVIVAGLPPLRGSTMKEKQEYFAAHCDHIRTSLMQEPRGHANMLGAVLTDPVTPDGDAGLLFLHPRGFFDMCVDSTFSSVAALIDSGIIRCESPTGERRIKLDTVAGRVDAHVDLRNGEPVAVTFNNVPSYSLGTSIIDLEGRGRVPAQLAYGGLTYAFVEARIAGIPSLKEVRREVLLDIGTQIWVAAREQNRAQTVDLVTLYEPLEGEAGARVANFYAPQTTGRTASGTGLSARVAIEAEAGRLNPGQTFIHESLLGLRFTARIAKTLPDPDSGRVVVIPAVTARSFMMGTAQWVLHPDDPFAHGFIL